MTLYFEQRYNYTYNQIMSHIGAISDEFKSQLSYGARILEWGSGRGICALRFAHAFPDSTVIGVDLHDAHIGLDAMAESYFSNSGYIRPTNLSFINIGTGSTGHSIALDNKTIKLDWINEANSVDLCYSWCVFEHVSRSPMQKTLKKIYEMVKKPSGLFYLYVNQLYFSSRGAHFYHIDKTPWVHLLYQHDELKEHIYKAAVQKGIRKYDVDIVWHQYETLNKVIAEDIRFMCEAVCFEVLFEKYQDEGEPSDELKRIYNEKILKNKDILLMMRPKSRA